MGTGLYFSTLWEGIRCRQSQKYFCDCLQRIPSQTGSTLKGKKMVLEELILFVRLGPHVKGRHENGVVVSPKNVSMRSCS